MNPHLALINFRHKNVWRNSNALHKKKIKDFFFANGIITSILLHSSSCRISEHFVNLHINSWNCLMQQCKATTPWMKSGISVVVKDIIWWGYVMEMYCHY